LRFRYIDGQLDRGVVEIIWFRMRLLVLCRLFESHVKTVDEEYQTLVSRADIPVIDMRAGDVFGVCRWKSEIQYALQLFAGS
jgi:hypothetical protein